MAGEIGILMDFKWHVIKEPNSEFRFAVYDHGGEKQFETVPGQHIFSEKDTMVDGNGNVVYDPTYSSCFEAVEKAIVKVSSDRFLNGNIQFECGGRKFSIKNFLVENNTGYSEQEEDVAYNRLVAIVDENKERKPFHKVLAYLKIAAPMYRNGFQKKANKLFLRAENIAKGFKDFSERSNLYALMGMYHWKAGMHDKAMKSFELAVEWLNKSQGSGFRFLIVIETIMENLLKSGVSADFAIKLADRMLIVVRENKRFVDEPIRQAHAIWHIANLKAVKGDRVGALVLYNESQTYIDKAHKNNKMDWSYSTLELGSLMIGDGFYDEGKGKMAEALSNISNIENLSDRFTFISLAANKIVDSKLNKGDLIDFFEQLIAAIGGMIMIKTRYAYGLELLGEKIFSARDIIGKEKTSVIIDQLIEYANQMSESGTRDAILNTLRNLR